MTEKKPKIYALPYAGGSSFSYLKWKAMFSGCDFIPLDYKGRGYRKQEAFDASIHEMAQDIALQLAKEEEPYLLYAHSMGTLVAWEACYELREMGNALPQVLALSAYAAPHLAIGRYKLRHLSTDDEIIEELLRIGHLRRDMLGKPIFQRDFLPVVLHDYRVLQKYGNSEEDMQRVPLRFHVPIPLMVFAASDDEIASQEAVREWEKYAENGYSFEPFEGGHFFFERADNLQKLCEALEQRLMNSISL